MNEKQPVCESAVLFLSLLDPVLVENPNLDAEVRISKTNILTCDDPQRLPDVGAVTAKSSSEA